LLLKVPLFVNKVTSTKTQLPYSYYDLPFCKPKHAKQVSIVIVAMIRSEQSTAPTSDSRGIENTSHHHPRTCVCYTVVVGPD
jgi:hypothetical protein